MNRVLRNALLTATAALVIGLASPVTAQAPVHRIDVNADAAACIADPKPACTAELALAAARLESEGWAATAAFEAFLSTDPDLAERDRWMARYEAWARVATVDGI
jgi:hypothetical protein